MFLGVTPTILRPSLLSAILKPQDVFATSLYTGTSAARSINNGLDLLGKGGLVWLKSRSQATAPFLGDTVRGVNSALYSNKTGAEVVGAFQQITGYSANGFNLGDDSAGQEINVSGQTYASWSFARAAKFFDIVTWTGDGTGNRQIPHGLGVVPGMILVKSRSAAGDWAVYHRGLSNPTGQFVKLNTTDAAFTNSGPFGATAPTATTFTVGNNPLTNTSGTTYVAYLFAHDPNEDGIVQCGASTADGNGNITIPHGWANGAQWAIIKRSTSPDNWYIIDTARGAANFGGSDQLLLANSAAAEQPADFASQSGGTLTVGIGTGTSIWAVIRAPY